jgi:predicted phosphodiesterase
MKTAFIADIHGNYEALKAVLAEIDNIGVIRTYCVGDTVGYYSQFNECIAELRKRNILSVLGNHDFYIISSGFCPRSRSANDCIAYQQEYITDINLNWLRSLPVHRLSLPDKIQMVHGGWSDPIDEYLDNPNEEYFSKIYRNYNGYFVSAHTHISLIKEIGDIIYCNPGSVGQPRDGDPRASFAIFDNETNKFTIHRVEYDMQKVFELMEKAGFDDYYYERLKTGAKNFCKL